MIHTLDNYTIAAVILAGGEACRMAGVPKGALQLQPGVSMIARLIHELRRTPITDIAISANDPYPYQHHGLDIISDVHPGVGPMAGIHSGLHHFSSSHDAVLFLPCDLPNITAAELQTLVDAFQQSQTPAVYAQTSPFDWHPLCAVAHKDLATPIAAAIDNGQRKIRNIWRAVGAVGVHFPSEAAFFNVNSYRDIARWMQNKPKPNVDPGVPRSGPDKIPTTA